MKGHPKAILLSLAVCAMALAGPGSIARGAVAQRHLALETAKAILGPVGNI